MVWPVPAIGPDRSSDRCRWRAQAASARRRFGAGSLPVSASRARVIAHRPAHGPTGTQLPAISLDQRPRTPHSPRSGGPSAAAAARPASRPAWAYPKGRSGVLASLRGAGDRVPRSSRCQTVPRGESAGAAGEDAPAARACRLPGPHAGSFMSLLMPAAKHGPGAVSSQIAAGAGPGDAAWGGRGRPGCSCRRGRRPRRRRRADPGPVARDSRLNRDLCPRSRDTVPGRRGGDGDLGCKGGGC